MHYIEEFKCITILPRISAAGSGCSKCEFRYAKHFVTDLLYISQSYTYNSRVFICRTNKKILYICVSIIPRNLLNAEIQTFRDSDKRYLMFFKPLVDNILSLFLNFYGEIHSVRTKKNEEDH